MQTAHFFFFCGCDTCRWQLHALNLSGAPTSHLMSATASIARHHLSAQTKIILVKIILSTSLSRFCSHPNNFVEIGREMWKVASSCATIVWFMKFKSSSLLSSTSWILNCTVDVDITQANNENTVILWFIVWKKYRKLKLYNSDNTEQLKKRCVNKDGICLQPRSPTPCHDLPNRVS